MKKEGAYRLVVGEVGNEVGYIIPSAAKTMAGARIALGKAIAKYAGDGWGRIEVLRVSAEEAQSGRDEWDEL